MRETTFFLHGVWLALFAVSVSCAEPGTGDKWFVSRGAIAKIRAPDAVQTADLDGDGDLDVLTSSENITWHENIDGRGTFRKPQVIASEGRLEGTACVADLDGDGDLDVLSVILPFLREGRLAWYENRDGRGHFGSHRVISPEPVGEARVAAADLDGDGDKDVLSAPVIISILHGYKLAWYENLDGRGRFGSQQIITEKAGSSTSLLVSDLDGDGDLDVLTGSSAKIAWYENVGGQPRFGPARTITHSHGAHSLFPADLDGDGDLDVLCGGSKIVWYENIDGHGNYNEQPRTLSESSGAASVWAADLDGDGDLDVLAATKETPTHGGISWYENTDRRGSFGAPQLVAGEERRAEAVTAGDLDGDRDADVIAALWAELWGGEISWYENRTNGGPGMEMP